MHYRINLNTTRGSIKALQDEAQRRTEAARTVRLLLAPADAESPISDEMVPDYLVTNSMVDRFLALDPPEFRVLSEFDPIIEDIERAYVLGLFFSALSAAVVTIERALNESRIELHKFVSPKIKELWGKGPLNEWEGNIAALETWKYISAELARELRELYGLRCQYLHSGPIDSLQTDALLAVRGAFQLLRSLLGFPQTLFKVEAGGIACTAPQDPLVKVFYRPVPDETGGAG